MASEEQAIDQTDVYAVALEGNPLLQRYLEAGAGPDLAPELRLIRATIAFLLKGNGSIRDLVELIGVVVRISDLQEDVEREAERMEEIRIGVQRLMAQGLIPNDDDGQAFDEQMLGWRE